MMLEARVPTCASKGLQRVADQSLFAKVVLSQVVESRQPAGCAVLSVRLFPHSQTHIPGVCSRLYSRGFLSTERGVLKGRRGVRWQSAHTRKELNTILCVKPYTTHNTFDGG